MRMESFSGATEAEAGASKTPTSVFSDESDGASPKSEVSAIDSQRGDFFDEEESGGSRGGFFASPVQVSGGDSPPWRPVRRCESDSTIDARSLATTPPSSSLAAATNFVGPPTKKKPRTKEVLDPSVVSVGRVPHSNAVFPRKLREICETEDYWPAISWDEEWGGVIIRDPDKMREEILPKFFVAKGQGDVYKSFRRQLVYYGFEEVTRGKHAPERLRVENPRTGVLVSICRNKDPNIRKLSDLDKCRRYVPVHNETTRKMLLKEQNEAFTNQDDDDDDDDGGLVLENNDDDDDEKRCSEGKALVRNAKSSGALSDVVGDGGGGRRRRRSSSTDHQDIAVILSSLKAVVAPTLS